jgi:hypothetical protein
VLRGAGQQDRRKSDRRAPAHGSAGASQVGALRSSSRGTQCGPRRRRLCAPPRGSPSGGTTPGSPDEVPRGSRARALCSLIAPARARCRAVAVGPGTRAAAAGGRSEGSGGPGDRRAPVHRLEGSPSRSRAKPRRRARRSARPAPAAPHLDLSLRAPCARSSRAARRRRLSPRRPAPRPRLGDDGRITAETRSPRTAIVLRRPSSRPADQQLLVTRRSSTWRFRFADGSRRSAATPPRRAGASRAPACLTDATAPPAAPCALPHRKIP